jgi:5-methylthioadenosine/S-adenosylhomocysteine deaminase
MLDILITNGTVVSMDKQRTIAKSNMYIKDGRIVGLGKEIKPANKVIDAAGHVVMPGLVNCHTHLYQSLIEGIGYDMHFEPWNWRFLVPIVSRMIPDHSYHSAKLAALEMIKTGTTTVCDHWYMHTDFDNIRYATKALDESGIRSKMIYGLLDKSFAGMEADQGSGSIMHSREELEKDFQNYFTSWHEKNLVTVGIGAGSTQDASEQLLISSKKVADSLGIVMSTHVAGWQDILASTFSRYGMRDVEFTHSRNLTGPNSLFIHTVWLSPHEISLLAQTHTAVVHCPAANSQLGYGIAPVAEMIQQGIAVGLGTDGAGSYTYDMFELMRMTAYLQKQKHFSADALTAEQALEIATIHGARALGMEDKIGSIEEGKDADLIILDFNQPHLMLTNRIVPKLVYSAHGSDVVTTIIHGQVVMENRQIVTVDEQRVLEDAERISQELVQGAEAETARLLSARWNSTKPYWML